MRLIIGIGIGEVVLGVSQGRILARQKEAGKDACAPTVRIVFPMDNVISNVTLELCTTC